MTNKTFSIDVILAPVCLDQTELDRVWIVIDVLRASSTIVTLMNKGCRYVYTVETITEARSLAQSKQLLLIGERKGLCIDGFDFSNSPYDLHNASLPTGKSAVLTTTNGTKAVEMVAVAPVVLIGCFLNANAVCKRAIELATRYNTDIGILCAGRKGRLALDDAFCAGYLVKNLTSSFIKFSQRVLLSDSGLVAQRLYESYPTISSGFQESHSGRLLKHIRCEKDLVICSKLGITEIVPYLIERNPSVFSALR